MPKPQCISKNSSNHVPRKKKTVTKAFLASQFGYSPLVWMFRKSIMNIINSFHERALKITYDDKCHLRLKTCREKITQYLSIIGM